MDVEIPKIQELKIHGILQDPQLLQDPSIILLDQPSQPSIAIKDRIPNTPLPSQSSIPELTLVIVRHVNPHGRFSINLNFETEHLELVEEFLDV